MRWRRLVASSAALSVLLWAVVAQAQTRVVTADLFRLNTGPCVLRSGSGSPEGAVTGNPCDHYLRTDQPELWEKKTGTETTGWQKAGFVGTLASTDLTDTANLARLNAANSFTLINPLTTLAESWIGPSSTAGVYFKGGNVGIGTTTPIGAGVTVGGSAAGYWMAGTGAPADEKIWQTVAPGDGTYRIRAWNDALTNYGDAFIMSRSGYGVTSLTLYGNVGVGTTTPTLFKLQTAGGVGPDAHATYDLGLTGTRWRAGYFSYLSADELHAKAFIADIEQALVGGQIISKSVVVVAAAFTLPAQGASTTFIVEDIANMAAVDVFVAGDFVRFRQFTRGVNTLDVADAWGTISATAHTHNGDGTQTWTFVRSATPNEGSASGTITRGQLVIDYGVSGDGLIEATVLDGLGQTNAPYTRYLTWTTHPKTGQAVRTQIGQLKGITSTAEFGLLAGTYAATDGQYFRASDQNFELHGIDLSLWDGATNVFAVRRNSTSPYLSLGSPAPSAYGANAGIFLGWSHASTKAQASFYADANNYWQYDGSKLTWKAANTTLDASGNLTATSASLSGAITATSGAIGGWSLGATSLTDTAGVVGMSSAVTGGDDIRFFAGHATPALAPFRLTEAGALTATSATLSGTLTITPSIPDAFNALNGVTWTTEGDNGNFGLAASFVNDADKRLYLYSLVGTDAVGNGLVDLYGRGRHTVGTEQRLYGRLKLGTIALGQDGGAWLSVGDSLVGATASFEMNALSGTITVTSNAAIILNGASFATSTGAITWGGDTNLYRSAANTLKTDDALIALSFSGSGASLTGLVWSGIDKTGSSLADLATRSASELSSGTLDDARLSSNVMLKNVALETTTVADYPVVWSTGNSLYYYKTDGYNGSAGGVVTGLEIERGIVTAMSSVSGGSSGSCSAGEFVNGWDFDSGVATGFSCGTPSPLLARLGRLERENAALWAELAALRALLAKEMR